MNQPQDQFKVTATLEPVPVILRGITRPCYTDEDVYLASHELIKRLHRGPKQKDNVIYASPQECLGHFNESLPKLNAAVGLDNATYYHYLLETLAVLFLGLISEVNLYRTQVLFAQEPEKKEETPNAEEQTPI